MSFKDKIKPPKQGIEMMIIALLCILVYLFSSQVDILERIVKFSQAHENYELDELITVAIFLAFALIIFIGRRMKEFQIASQLMQKKNKKLEEAIAEIKQLKGIIPICASCKMIRDDDGYWHQVEVYVKEHSDAEFSHGLCTDCVEKLYPYNNSDKKDEK